MWNYRVIRKRHADDSLTFPVHEVCCRDDGGMESWTEEPVTPMGEEVAELRADRKLRGTYEKAEEALAELYQQTGRLEFDKDMH